MSQGYRISISSFTLDKPISQKVCEPDERGFYEVVVGCLGIPTRNNVVYDPDSVIECMTDPTSRFNICLRDGNLLAEYSHPVIESKEDLNRLLRIDEHYVSHVFGKIWTDDPIMIHGKEAIPIRALVKPCGPYGDVLEKSLRDPYINTAFSIRSLCLPSDGPDRSVEYRKVQMIITFDAVHAPGFDITSKRYVPSNESFEYKVSVDDLKDAVQGHMGMESTTMINDKDIEKMLEGHTFRMDGRLMGAVLNGKKSYRTVDGKYKSAAELLYRR